MLPKDPSYRTDEEEQGKIITLFPEDFEKSNVVTTWRIHQRISRLWRITVNTEMLHVMLNIFLNKPHSCRKKAFSNMQDVSKANMFTFDLMNDTWPLMLPLKPQLLKTFQSLKLLLKMETIITFLLFWSVQRQFLQNLKYFFYHSTSLDRKLKVNG